MTVQGLPAGAGVRAGVRAGLPGRVPDSCSPVLRAASPAARMVRAEMSPQDGLRCRVARVVTAESRVGSVRVARTRSTSGVPPASASTLSATSRFRRGRKVPVGRSCVRSSGAQTVCARMFRTMKPDEARYTDRDAALTEDASWTTQSASARSTT